MKQPRNFHVILAGLGALTVAAVAAYADTPTTAIPAPPPPPLASSNTAPSAQPAPAPKPAPASPSSTPPVRVIPVPATSPGGRYPGQPNMPTPPPPPMPSEEQPVSDAALNAPGIRVNMPDKIVVSGIAARVNGVVITNQQLVDQFIRDGAQTTLNEMITAQLVEQEAAKEHITITHPEIVAKYKEFKTDVLKQAPAGYNWTQILSAEGRSEDYALEQVRLRLLLEKLVGSKIPPVSLAGKIHIYHILIATVPLPPQHPVAHSDAEAHAKVQQIYNDIMAGKITFKDAAREYSEDDSTAKPSATGAGGGDLGWVGRDSQLDPKFAAAAFNLKPGQISQPVKSQYGWHLIYLEKTGEQATQAEKDKIHDDEVAQEAPQLIQQYMRSLRDGAVIDRVLMPGVPLPPQGNPMGFPVHSSPASPANRPIVPMRQGGMGNVPPSPQQPPMVIHAMPTPPPAPAPAPTTPPPAPAR